VLDFVTEPYQPDYLLARNLSLSVLNFIPAEFFNTIDKFEGGFDFVKFDEDI
jgi:hypothetical protein